MNQRLTIVAARTRAVIPVPPPTMTPQSSISCHGDFMKIVSETPVATVASEIKIVLRRPNQFMIAAANGPISP